MTKQQTPARVGFIGLGAMGVGMAANIVAKGHPLTVLGHSRREPVERLLGLGAEEAASPADLTRRSDVVFICVTTSEAVESNVFGDDGVLAGCERPIVLVDCGTSQPASTLRIGAALRERGSDMLDAPLGRTPAEAETGNLNVMVGGERATYEQVLPVLQTFGENIFHVGELGVGHKLKLINNFYAQSVACLVAEAVCAAKGVGVNAATLHEVMAAGPNRSVFFDWMFDMVLHGDPSGLRFALKNAKKDVGYFADMVAEQQLPSIMAPATNEMLGLAVEHGHGDDPVATLIPFFEAYARQQRGAG